MVGEHEDLNKSVAIPVEVSKHLPRADVRLISVEKLHIIVVEQNSGIYVLQAMPIEEENKIYQIIIIL